MPEPKALRLNCETIRLLSGITRTDELNQTWVCPASDKGLSVCDVAGCVNSVTFDTARAPTKTETSVPHSGVKLEVIALAILHGAVIS